MNSQCESITHQRDTQRVVVSVHPIFLNLLFCISRFSAHQNNADLLGVFRGSGPGQRLQFPQTSGIHTCDQDSTNRSGSLLAHLWFCCADDFYLDALGAMLYLGYIFNLIKEIINETHFSHTPIFLIASRP